jgi:hypothetical protein
MKTEVAQELQTTQQKKRFFRRVKRWWRECSTPEKQALAAIYGEEENDH